MKILRLSIWGALILVPGAFAAPIGSFSGSFPSYSTTATCSNPPGAVIRPPGSCSALSIPVTATGSTSLFANSQLTVQETQSGPAYSGTFTLIDLSNPADSIFGTLAGQLTPTGPPNATGFPPFQLNGLLTTTGGTGAFVGATGLTQSLGTSVFTSINGSRTSADGGGRLDFTAIPEPATRLLTAGALTLFGAKRARRPAHRGFNLPPARSVCRQT